MLAAESLEEALLESSVNNCIICLETVSSEDSVSLHASYDHRMHLDCLHPFLVHSTQLNCPLCQSPMTKDLLDHYKAPETTLAAYIRNNDVELTDGQINKYVYAKGFNLEKLCVHFQDHVNKSNANLERLQRVIISLKHRFRFKTLSDPVSLTTLNFLDHASCLFPFKQFLVTDHEQWVIDFISVAKMGLESNEWDISWRILFFTALLDFMDSNRFITADLWKMACEFDCSELLQILLPHAVPSCFNDGVTGIGIAINEDNVRFLTDLITFDPKNVMKSLRVEVASPDFICYDPLIIDLLIENGFKPEELFSLTFIRTGNRKAIVTLIRHGFWPLMYFMNLNGPYFLELKARIKAHSTSEFLRDAFDLCLTLFGILFYPDIKENIIALYSESRETGLLATEFEKLVDLCSNERIYNQVVKTLTALIQNSWNSLNDLGAIIRANPSRISGMYDFKICQSIPFLSPGDQVLVENKHGPILQLLGVLGIPTKVSTEFGLKTYIEIGDSEGLEQYLVDNTISPAELDKAMTLSFIKGNTEIAMLLVKHSLEIYDPDSGKKQKIKLDTSGKKQKIGRNRKSS